MKNKKIIILTVAGLIVLGGILVYAFNRNASTPNNGDGINYGPPTEQELKDTEANKNNVIKRQELEKNWKTPNPSEVKKVTPIITSYGQSGNSVEIAARVPSVFEDGGQCTLIMTKNGKSVKSTRNGSKNVSEVTCGFIQIHNSKLSPGDWTAQVSYDSPTAKGVSSSRTIRVR